MMRLFILLLLITLAKTVAAQTHIWTGNVNTDWNNAGHWSTGAVPDSLATVRINTVSTGIYPVLSSSVKVNSFWIVSANVNIGSFSINSDDVNFSNAGIYSSNGSIKTVSISGWLDSQIYGNLNVETEFGVINGGNVFNDELSINVKKCTHCATYWWPMGYLYISYNKGDTFKAATQLVSNGTHVQIGNLPTTTTFEKKTVISINNGTPGSTRLLFSTKGGRVVFKDSTSINFSTWETGTGVSSSSGITFSSLIDFEKPLFLTIEGGFSLPASWIDYTPPSNGQGKASIFNFYGDVWLDLKRGFLSLGSGHAVNDLKNTTIFNTTSQLKIVPGSFTEGILQLINTKFNSPLGTSIICSTYPALLNSKTNINFSGVVSKGDFGCISKLRFLVFGIKKVLYPQVFSPFGLLFG